MVSAIGTRCDDQNHRCNSAGPMQSAGGCRRGTFRLNRCDTNPPDPPACRQTRNQRSGVLRASRFEIQRSQEVSKFRQASCSSVVPVVRRYTQLQINQHHRDFEKGWPHQRSFHQRSQARWLPCQFVMSQSVSHTSASTRLGRSAGSTRRLTPQTSAGKPSTIRSHTPPAQAELSVSQSTAHAESGAR